MKILCVGDVVGGAGCAHLRKILPEIKQRYSVDVCIVNGENAADGNGLTPSAAGHIFDSGADVITGGNHTFRRRELYNVLDSCFGRLTILPPRPATACIWWTAAGTKSQSSA